MFRAECVNRLCRFLIHVIAFLFTMAKCIFHNSLGELKIIFWDRNVSYLNRQWPGTDIYLTKKKKKKKKKKLHTVGFFSFRN